MKAGYFGLLVLQAATAVVASPAPAETERAQEDVFSLAEQAYKAAEQEAKSSELSKRTGDETCSWNNIRIRREW